MEFFDRWADSKNARFHYLDCDDYEQHITSLIYIPGVLNYAEQSIDLIEEFNPRRCISISLRGRALDSSENANAFPSCVGRFEEAFQCPAGSAAKVRRRLNDPMNHLHPEGVKRRGG